MIIRFRFNIYLNNNISLNFKNYFKYKIKVNYNKNNVKFWLIDKVKILIIFKLNIISGLS